MRNTLLHLVSTVVKVVLIPLVILLEVFLAISESFPRRTKKAYYPSGKSEDNGRELCPRCETHDGLSTITN